MHNDDGLYHEHHDGHDHAHDHDRLGHDLLGHDLLGHHHHPAPARFNTAFAMGIGLNLSYVAGEAVYGVAGHSLALMADAGHNLGDVLGLAGAWLAASLARRAPEGRFTYGWRRSSILAALVNALLLLAVTSVIGWESIRRLFQPTSVAGAGMMVTAAIGIAVNGISALLFFRGRDHDLNLRAAFAHLAGDAMVAFGVVIAGGLIWLTGVGLIDPAVSLIVSVINVLATWSLLRDSVSLALDATPPAIELDKVRFYLRHMPGVDQIHDLHVWPMSTTETALTCHLLMSGGHPGDQFLVRAAAELRARFNIGHTTIQIETDPATACVLAPEHEV